MSVREEYEEAVRFYVQVVSEVQPFQWALRASRRQTVLEVAVQGSRPLTTTRDFIRAGASEATLHGPLGYVVAALSRPDIGAGAERGREALERFQKGDPATVAEDLAAESLTVVRATADDALVGTQVGGIRLIEYLPTRTMELVLIGMEIADAIGSPTAPGSGSLTVAVELLCALAIAAGNGPMLLKTIWTEVPFRPLERSSATSGP